MKVFKLILIFSISSFLTAQEQQITLKIKEVTVFLQNGKINSEGNIMKLQLEILLQKQ